MKKLLLLLLLFLIPNFSFAEKVNSFNQANQATETDGFVDKYLIIDNHSPPDWWPLNSSTINEEWLDDKSLNLYNIKKGWDDCSFEIDINPPSASKKSETISLNRNIEFISLRKFKEKVEIDIEEQKGNYYGLLVKLKIFKNYEINSAPVYLNIDKYFPTNKSVTNGHALCHSNLSFIKIIKGTLLCQASIFIQFFQVVISQQQQQKSLRFRCSQNVHQKSLT